VECILSVSPLTHVLIYQLFSSYSLANPTNFTKMGLWTLGQQSKGPDPIAGILQKELDIQPQQGRKIIEQRQKIRNVCSNLKEVRTLRERFVDNKHFALN
jgi:hypothetical protein